MKKFNKRLLLITILFVANIFIGYKYIYKIIKKNNSNNTNNISNISVDNTQEQQSLTDKNYEINSVKASILSEISLQKKYFSKLTINYDKEDNKVIKEWNKNVKLRLEIVSKIKKNLDSYSLEELKEIQAILSDINSEKKLLKKLSSNIDEYNVVIQSQSSEDVKKQILQKIEEDFKYPLFVVEQHNKIILKFRG